MDGVKPAKDSTYWLYVLSGNIWDQFRKYIDRCPDDGMYLGSSDGYNLIKNKDIIIIYLKDRARTGFVAVCKAGSDQVLTGDSNIKIFTDRFLNRYSFKLSDLTIFDEPVKLQQVMGTIKKNFTGYRNVAGFTNKFLINTGAMVKIEHRGLKLMKRLFDITELPHDPDDSSSSSSSSRKDNTNSTSTSTTNTSPSTSEQDGEDDEDEDEDEGEDEGEDDDEDGCSFREIPVLVVPCEGFRWPAKTTDRAKYFTNHYLTCTECDITDNNSIRLERFLDKSVVHIETVDKNSKSDKLKEWYEFPIKDYLNLTDHLLVTVDPNRLPFVRVVCINNGDEIYQGCLLVSFQVEKK